MISGEFFGLNYLIEHTTGKSIMLICEKNTKIIMKA